MIGPIGSHLSTLCRLALHISDIPIHPMDTSKHNTFLDGLRSAVRLAGAEGKVLTLFFTVSPLDCLAKRKGWIKLASSYERICFQGRDLEDPLYLDAINSLLASGEYPYLFTNDELDGLLMVSSILISLFLAWLQLIPTLTICWRKVVLELLYNASNSPHKYNITRFW